MARQSINKVLLVFSLICLIFLSCVEYEDALMDEIEQEMNNIMNEFVAQLKIELRKEVDRKVDEAKNDVIQAVGPFKEDQYRLVLEYVKMDHGSLPILPVMGAIYDSEDLSLQCATWAKARRISIGAEPLVEADGCVRNYLQPGKYFKSIKQFVDRKTSGDLLEVGAVLLLAPPNFCGHVSIIEIIQEDGVWVSEQNWPYKHNSNNELIYNGKAGKNEVRLIKNDALKSIYIIPRLAKED